MRTPSNVVKREEVDELMMENKEHTHELKEMVSEFARNNPTPTPSELNTTLGIEKFIRRNLARIDRRKGLGPRYFDDEDEDQDDYDATPVATKPGVDSPKLAALRNSVKKLKNGVASVSPRILRSARRPAASTPSGQAARQPASENVEKKVTQQKQK